MGMVAQHIAVVFMQQLGLLTIIFFYALVV